MLQRNFAGFIPPRLPFVMLMETKGRIGGRANVEQFAIGVAHAVQNIPYHSVSLMQPNAGMLIDMRSRHKPLTTAFATSTLLLLCAPNAHADESYIRQKVVVK